MKCPKCASKFKRKKVSKYHFLESGLSNVYLGNIFINYCPYHMEVMTPDLPKLQELLDVILVDVILNPQPLRGEEIRYLRQSIDYTQAGFAGLLGVTSNTVARWEREELQPSVAMDLTIRRTVLLQADDEILSLLKRRVQQLSKEKIKFGADLNKFREASKEVLTYPSSVEPLGAIPRALKRKNNPLLVQEEAVAYAFSK